jgi:hypothetical protein
MGMNVDEAWRYPSTRCVDNDRSFRHFTFSDPYDLAPSEEKIGVVEPAAISRQYGGILEQSWLSSGRGVGGRKSVVLGHCITGYRKHQEQ